MTNPLRLLAVVPALCSCLAAQLPTDGVLLLEQSPQMFGTPAYVLADAFGGGSTELPVFTGPFGFAPPSGVAVDPTAVGRFFTLDATTAVVPGIRRIDLGLLGTVSGTPTGAPWTQAGGERLRVGTTRVFTLRQGIVEGTLKAGGAPVVVLTTTDAIDLALAEPFVYVMRNVAGQPAPLLERNLQNGVQRTVGNYQDVLRIAASPIAPRLALGFDDRVDEIDVATGAVVATVPTNGPVLALGYTRQGALVHAVATGQGYEVRSQLASRPIHVGIGELIDLDVARVVTPSAIPFGDGCGLGRFAGWTATGLPALGNAAFGLGLRALPPATATVLCLGQSRFTSSVFGAPLPIDLTPVGATSCLLAVDPLVPLLASSDATGGIDQSLPIPTNPLLLGAEFVAQGFVPDVTVGPLGLAATPAVAFRIF